MNTTSMAYTHSYSVPFNKHVDLPMTSKDVIHDFWVEQLAQKKDVFPGRTTHTWFDANRVGTYEGQCAEFCGAGHATMSIVVRVVSKEEYTSFMNSKSVA